MSKKNDDLGHKAYVFRIYPNAEQKILFAKTFGCCRFVYNHWLYIRKTAYTDKKESVSYNKCSQQLTDIKKAEEYSFLKEVDSIALQQALRHLDEAFQSFFTLQGKGYPRYKSKKENDRSYTTNCVNGNIELSNGYIKLPKIGKVKIKQHRKIPDSYILKSVTVKQTPTGKYYVSILFEYEKQVQIKELLSFLGLDYSMHELYKDSNGNEPAYPRYYRSAEKKLAKEQRKLSHMQKGSSNRNKQRTKVAKLHEKVADQRKDFLHKLSRQIANAYDCICIEDLNMKAMSRSLNFGKSVSDNGWGMFTAFLKYKLEEQGKRLIRVDKFFASFQTCNVCGYKNNATKDLSIREWDCPQCGTHHDRDVNSAINIKNEGVRMLLA